VLTKYKKFYLDFLAMLGSIENIKVLRCSARSKSGEFMLLKEAIKEAILKLESLCKSYEKGTLIEFEDLEEKVSYLTHEVQGVDLASDQTLRRELETLQGALIKLSSVLNVQQETLARHVQEIHVHQRALHAYARVANNNIGSLELLNN